MSIERGIAGRGDVVVSHEPDHLLRKYQHPDLHKAINEAFRIAERRLLDVKELREDREKAAAHDVESQSLGQIAEVTPEQDFGFLMTKEGGLLYFHRNSVLSGDFDHLARGDEVHYNEDVGDTGPIATKVRVKQKDGTEVEKDLEESVECHCAQPLPNGNVLIVECGTSRIIEVDREFLGY